MKYFVDTGGNVWPINLDAAAIERVRTVAGISLCGRTAMDSLQALVDLDTGDQFALAISEPDITARGMSDTDFPDLLARSDWQTYGVPAPV